MSIGIASINLDDAAEDATANVTEVLTLIDEVTIDDVPTAQFNLLDKIWLKGSAASLRKRLMNELRETRLVTSDQTSASFTLAFWTEDHAHRVNIFETVLTSDLLSNTVIAFDNAWRNYLIKSIASSAISRPAVTSAEYCSRVIDPSRRSRASL